MIFKQLSSQLLSLNDLLLKLNEEQYMSSIEHLSNSSIGEHTRHIIELVQCAIHGYQTGEVDYINRTRNLDLQTNLKMACAVLKNLSGDLPQEDKKLKLITSDQSEDESHSVFTTYFREIVYNTEHAIHHLALIRVALFELNLNLTDKKFGVAYSTIKYRAILSDS
jgi:hypothetical protein